MSRDNIYLQYRDPVPPFEFDEDVARVFDDMIHRSIPYYREILEQEVKLIRRYYQGGSSIYDLGCSNGNLGLTLCRHMGKAPFKMIAVDNSEPMLAQYQERLEEVPSPERIDLVHEDIQKVPIDNASVVVLNFTLQFLGLDERKALLQRIHAGLLGGGVLLFCEKITHDHQQTADLQQEVYHAFKRDNGYSELEISQKREALEMVLIPETVTRHQQRLQRVGFQGVDVWFKWFNFAAMVAFK